MQAADRTARSVFVGNISYEITEAELLPVFSQVGKVVHFRLVTDRETGRPKGFGFCEYADEQMAMAAQRSLNGYELHGRALRVDSASGNGERSAEEVQQFQLEMAAAAHADENPYGPEPEVGRAPEAVAQTVASMPPERMFELMRQMKETVYNNSQMARQLLMENPQLAYALLQAQVVMRVVDPKVAYSMLHREVPATTTPFHQQVAPLEPSQTTSPPGIVHGGGPPQMNFSAPPPQVPNMAPPMMTHPPPVASKGYGMPPPNLNQQPPSTSNAPPTGMAAPSGGRQQGPELVDEQAQAEILVRVMSLSEDELRVLPPEDRAKVIELRNQLRQRVET